MDSRPTAAEHRMLTLTRSRDWSWKPCFGKRREGPFAYRWMAIGHWQVALLNPRLEQELQRQIRAQVYR